MWRNYQELVDQVIESVLIAVGGSIAQLEDALDDIATTDPKGITFYSIVLINFMLCFSVATIFVMYLHNSKIIY